jgi:hypothetical protein
MEYVMLIAVRLILLSLLGVAVLPTSMSLAAKDKVYTSTFSNLAVSGYDPVSYFQEGKALEGDDRFIGSWNGTRWRFVSAANRDTFLADPVSFAPQFGGYCAWAVSQGYTAEADPEAWHISKGKLYLNFSRGVQNQWKQDMSANIVKGDSNWPKVLEQ